MKIVYIAHPISNDPIGNLEKIRAIVRNLNLTEPEILPFVPYYADIVSMNDHVPEERERGIRNDKEWFTRKVIDEVWVYGDYRKSKGVQAEIELAKNYGIPVLIKSLIANEGK